MPYVVAMEQQTPVLRGFKAEDHPPGGAGVAQCVELYQQLRGKAVNQVYAARIALAHNIGGPTAMSAVMTVEGPGTNGY